MPHSLTRHAGHGKFSRTAVLHETWHCQHLPAAGAKGSGSQLKDQTPPNKINKAGSASCGTLDFGCHSKLCPSLTVCDTAEWKRPQHPDKNWKSDAQNIFQIPTLIEFERFTSLRIKSTTATEALLSFLQQGAWQLTVPRNFVEVLSTNDSPKYHRTQYAQKQSENILLLCHNSFVRVCSHEGGIHFLGRNQVMWL